MAGEGLVQSEAWRDALGEIEGAFAGCFLSDQPRPLSGNAKVPAPATMRRDLDDLEEPGR